MLILVLRMDETITLETADGEITIKLQQKADREPLRYARLCFDLPDSVIARRSDMVESR